ncbi:MAG: TPM domain-containing protein [Clostridium sp.]
MNSKKLYNRLWVSFCLLLLFIPSILCNATPNFKPPTQNKYINDYVGVVNSDYTQKIISIGYELESKCGAEAVIVIVNSLDGYDIESYANKLFRNFGIGQKNKNNGLLILLAMNEKNFRVEVGSGLEGVIPDALTNRVMESLAKPRFIERDYGLGLLESYSTFCDLISKEYNVILDKSLNISLPSENNSSSNGFFIGGGVIGLFLLDMLLNRGRISNTLLQLLFISNISRRGPRGGSGGSGFGGFGGGSSNGGGSSGNW